MLTTATSKMPKRLMKWSAVSRIGTPVVVDSRTLAAAAGTPTTSDAVARPRSSLSRTAEITTSITLTREVKPATTSDPKNSTPIRAPAGAWEMIAGNATKARPSPDRRAVLRIARGGRFDLPGQRVRGRDLRRPRQARPRPGHRVACRRRAGSGRQRPTVRHHHRRTDPGHRRPLHQPLRHLAGPVSY